MTQENPTPILKTPTAAERVLSNPVTEGALSVGAALGAAAGAGTTGALLLPLIPMLAKFPAGERQKKRFELAIAEITDVLQRHTEQLEQITDENYRLLNEAVATIFATTEQSKIELLKKVAQNAVIGEPLTPHESYALPRVLRDISVSEVAFLSANFAFKHFSISDTSNDVALSGAHNAGRLNVRSNSPDAALIVGLQTLGVFAVVTGTFDGTPILAPTRLAAKLLALLR